MKINTLKTISTSLFNQGQSGKIFNQIADNKERVLVVKNNHPLVVILGYDQYCKICRIKNPLQAIELNEIEKEEKENE